MFRRILTERNAARERRTRLRLAFHCLCEIRVIASADVCLGRRKLFPIAGCSGVRHQCEENVSSML